MSEASAGPRTPAPRAGETSLALRGLHLAALWAFALPQPLFDLLGRNAQFFAARGNTASDILLFALGVAILPPLALLAFEWIVDSIRSTAAWVLHLLFVAVLSGAVVLPVVGDLLAGSSVALVVAAIIGAVAATLYARARGVRSFLTVLSPAPVLFLLLFLVTTPVAKLVLPSDASAEVAGPARSSTPIVVVVFDELATGSIMGEDGHVDRKQFPNLARFARESTWYRNASTVADGTTEALPAILTGREPVKGELPTDSDHPRNLFTLLGRSHELHVTEPITDLCPDRLCGESRPGPSARLRSLASDLRVVSLHLLLPEDMRDDLPAIDRGWEGFGEEVPVPVQSDEEIQRRRVEFLQEVVQREGATDPVRDFNEMVSSIRPGADRPPLAFLHVELPHVPWRFLPDGRQYPVRRAPYPGLDSERWTGGQWLADQGFQRHLLQTGFTDRLIGALLRRMKAVGLYDDSLIVFTADHGVSFRDGEGRRAVSERNLADIALVPLFVKSPGQRSGRVDDGAVRTTDILPTMATELGTPIPWDVDGVPAVERAEDPSTRIAVYHVGTEPVAKSFGELLHQRAERERYERLLIGNSPYEIGPRSELVGRAVDELDVMAATGRLGVELDAPAELVSIRPESGVVPAYVSGAVSGLAPGDEVAVAVDGRIESTTRVRREGDALVFAAMVDPSSLGRGSKSVDVFRIPADGRLQSLGGLKPEAPYRLVGANGEEALVRGRERIPVEPEAVTGYVDSAAVDDRVLGMTGWAAPADLSRPADRVIVVAQGRQIEAQRPTVVREELGAWRAPLRTAGYEFSIPLPEIDSAGADLRVFGIADGRATSLKAIGNVPDTLASLR